MNIEYNYNDYINDLSTVVNEIRKNDKKYDLIVGIAKGGLIPAVHLANIFNLPFASLQWSGKGIRDCFNQQLLDAKDKNVLLVDDILDSGDTISEVLAVYKPMDIATLIYNSVNKHNLEPTYTGWIINRNEIPEWFDFWWEKL